MSTDVVHRQVASKFFDALAANDIELLIGIMHPDIVWEVPGSSPAAGRCTGLDAVGAMMLRISAMAGGNVATRATELFVNDDGVLALVEVDILPDGDTAWHGEDAWLVRTDGHQVTHVREHWFDTSGFDGLVAWQRASAE